MIYVYDRCDNSFVVLPSKYIGINVEGPLNTENSFLKYTLSRYLGKNIHFWVEASQFFN